MALRDLDDLDFFVTLARSSSLTAAASEWGVSLPQVSKRLAALEDRLATQLVRRSTRGLTLTPEGEIYASQASQIRRQIDDLEDAVSGRRTMLRGTITVVATPGIGHTHIGPLLGQFAERHGELGIRLELSANPVAKTGWFDLAIRVGGPPDQRFRGRELAPNKRILVASPEYLAAHGMPQTLDDLRHHNCLVLRENGSDFAQWQFTQDGVPVQRAVTGTMSSNDGDVVTDWCLAGLGIAMRSSWHVAPLLASGELVHVLPAIATPRAPVTALIPTDRTIPRRVSALVDHLAQELPGRLA